MKLIKVAFSMCLISLWIINILSLKQDIGTLIEPGIFTVDRFIVVSTLFAFTCYGLYSALVDILSPIIKF